jgi:hypothetical protein
VEGDSAEKLLVAAGRILLAETHRRSADRRIALYVRVDSNAAAIRNMLAKLWPPVEFMTLDEFAAEFGTAEPVESTPDQAHDDAVA